MIPHEAEIRVRYRDTDQMGVVYHAVYLEFFETGRTELLRNVGMAYASMERAGVMLPVLEACIRMYRPARYDNLLRVVTHLVRPVTARLRLEYEIHHDGVLLVSGYTVHAFTTVEGMKPVRPPRDFLRIIEGGE